MSSIDYSRLEKDVKFSGKFIPNRIWIKNIVFFLAPLILLIFSTFSIIYLYKVGKLASLVTIPYLIAFIFSVIFLRFSKTYVAKKEIAQDGKYLICLGKIVKEDNKKIYMIFSKGEKRHNEHFIEKNAKLVAVDDLPELNHKDPAYLLSSSTIDEEIYLKTFRRKDIIEKHKGYDVNNLLPLEYLDLENVFLISRKIKRI